MDKRTYKTNQPSYWGAAASLNHVMYIVLDYLFCSTTATDRLFSGKRFTLRRPIVSHCRHVGAEQLPRWYPSAPSLSSYSTKWFRGFQSLILYIDWTSVCYKFSAPKSTFQQVSFKPIGRYPRNIIVCIPSRCFSTRSRRAKFVAKSECNIPSVPFAFLTCLARFYLSPLLAVSMLRRS